MREYYDLWPEFFPKLGLKGRLKEKIRRGLIRSLDTHLLKHNVSRLLAQSRTIQQRLKTWGRIESEVLYPPPPQRNYRTESYDNFILAVSRLHKLKRLDLLIKAVSSAENKEMKAVIIGDGPEKDALRNEIKALGLENRISLIGEATEGEVMDAFARCRAVFFSPLREDYGLVTGEAFMSRKGVITTEDSGGPAELVENGRTGFVLPPDPSEIARKLDLLAEDASLAEKIGERAFQFIIRFSWEKTVQSLIIS